MSEHESDLSDRDGVAGRKEYRAARVQGEHPPGASLPEGGAADVASNDDALVGSEAMAAEGTLSSLGNPNPGKVPPGKQLSGEPPAV